MQTPTINKLGIARYNDENVEPPNPHEVQLCTNWLRAFATKRKSLQRRATSASYKTAVEKWAGEYVSNGAFIAAAVAEGYTIREDDFSPRNAHLNIVLPRRRTPQWYEAGFK